MNHIELLLTILGMAAVTYVPRLVPLLLPPDRAYPAPVRRFLTYLPFAILGALIMPGALHATGDTLSSAAGLAVAVLLAWRRANLLIIVLGAVGAASVVTLFGV